MEDKIKQLYEAISSSSDFTGIFTTPEEMVSTYNKDPNGFFDAINSSADFSGIFKDAEDFATSVGLKKKTSLSLRRLFKKICTAFHACLQIIYSSPQRRSLNQNQLT